MPFLYESDFKLGETVYFRLGSEPGFITGINFNGSGVLYWVTWADERGETRHFAYELARVPNYGRKVAD